MENIFNSFIKLKNYCEKNNFSGWDPYDGLNSKLIRVLQLHKSKFLRIAIIQFNKKSPINFRRILLTPKDENPKALALFLSAYCNLYKINSNPEYLPTINYLANKITLLQSKGYSGACWGYNFDWQSRAFFLPKYTPTVVATSFVAYSLIDAYEVTGNETYLKTAISSKDFIINDLKRTNVNNGFIFSYSPIDNSVVYNASLLGSRLLSRIYSFTSEKHLIDIARKSVLACVEAQNEDGSWKYGAMEIQSWIDSFHTGFNIESLYDYQKYSADTNFNKVLEKGLEFYRKHFFLENGIPKYYHNKTYPIDLHALAEYIRVMYITNKIAEEKQIIEKALNWSIENMQSAKGYFYFQKNKYFTIKIPYMRWPQAWMMYGISHYLRFLNYDTAV